MNETFGTILLNQLNNPDCSMLTGMFVGSFIMVKWLITLIAAYIILEALDKLAFEPLLNWIKRKIYGGKNWIKRKIYGGK